VVDKPKQINLSDDELLIFKIGEALRSLHLWTSHQES
jgi:hypothetical protein